MKTPIIYADNHEVREAVHAGILDSQILLKTKPPMVVSGDSAFELGYLNMETIKLIQKAKLWEDIRHEYWKPQDKQLVWAWDDNQVASRYLKYYDAKNESTFDFTGQMYGTAFDYYSPYHGELPKGMMKAGELEC